MVNPANALTWLVPVFCLATRFEGDTPVFRLARRSPAERPELHSSHLSFLDEWFGTGAIAVFFQGSDISFHSRYKEWENTMSHSFFESLFNLIRSAARSGGIGPDPTAGILGVDQKIIKSIHLALSRQI